MSEHWDLDEAVKGAFRSPEEGEKYLDRILTSCKEASAGVRRLLILLILCMASFELLNRAEVEKITLAFIQLKDKNNVATFLPVVVAYLQYQLLRQLLYWRSLERTFTAAIAVVQPGVARNQLANYVIPTVPLFSNRHPKGATFENVFSFQQRAEKFFVVLCALLLPAFQVYAFSELYSSINGKPPIMFIVALCMSAILTLAYVTAIAVLLLNVILWWFHKQVLREDSNARQWLLMVRRRIPNTRSQ